MSGYLRTSHSMPKRSRKSSRQAEAGEVVETERATYKHEAEAVDNVAA